MRRRWRGRERRSIWKRLWVSEAWLGLLWRGVKTLIVVVTNVICMGDLSKINRKVEDDPSVSWTQWQGSSLHVYMQDRPREYEVTVQDDGTILVIESDTMGGGQIGGTVFESAESAARYITAI